MIRSFNAGTCFGLSLRTGMLIVMLILLAVTFSDIAWRWHVHFHENTMLHPMIKPLMFDYAPLVLYVLVVCDFILAGAVIVTEPGRAKSQLGKAWLIFMIITCLWWLVVGFHMSARLRDFRKQFGVSGALNKAQEKDTRVAKILRGKGRGTVLQGAAFLADRTVAGMMSGTLPEPIGELIWLSWNPGLVVILFGLIPFGTVGSTLIYVASYVHVVSRGGDGTECLEGGKIEEFYDALAEEENLEERESSMIAE
ncbi:hypothetical protein FOZ60_007814 [Perkinsus olseni]|uniref:Uncharacterized protein n=1 Tax=Perkinsus olseni TaxID=32597 RepID=A0A7J6PF61_PEROL|nr:hypothetical protein FOZ60_007814 [Perkinsus olseni]